MRKIFYVTMLTFLLFSYPLNISAQDISSSLVTYGITEEGISYQMYGEILSTTANSITVTKRIVYNGEITPSASLSWTEKIDGISYSGTLRLMSFNYDPSTNQTTTTYYGTLYKK